MQTHTLPRAPRDLQATYVGREQVAVQWAAPASGAFTSYRLELDGQAVVTSERAHTFTGLAAGSTHVVRLAALNAAGQQSATRELRDHP